jgi:hypothetical protein
MKSARSKKKAAGPARRLRGTSPRPRCQIDKSASAMVPKSMNGHALRIATTTTMEDCLKAAMIAAIHDEPQFSELFMAYLLTRNSRIEEDLIDQLFNSSEKRLARLLLLLANFGKEGSPQPISPNVSQETAGRDGRHHPIPRQPFHEQVSQAGPH